MSANNDTFTDEDSIDRGPHISSVHETPADLPGYDEWLARHEMTDEEIDRLCEAEEARYHAELPPLKPIEATVVKLNPAIWGKAVQS
jgi:hypothetical protein